VFEASDFGEAFTPELQRAEERMREDSSPATSSAANLEA
jgi:hypothetical protein